MGGSITKFGKVLGRRIRRRREELGIGLRELAYQVGLSPGYLSQLENGIARPPGEDRIRALAEALDEDADELLSLAGRAPSELVELIRYNPATARRVLESSRMLEHVRPKVGVLVASRMLEHVRPKGLPTRTPDPYSARELRRLSKGKLRQLRNLIDSILEEGE